MSKSFRMRLAVGQAQTADELGDGESFKTIHRSSKVGLVNVESRSAYRTHAVSSIHQSDQTSTASLVVGNMYK